MTIRALLFVDKSQIGLFVKQSTTPGTGREGTISPCEVLRAAVLLPI